MTSVEFSPITILLIASDDAARSVLQNSVSSCCISRVATSMRDAHDFFTHEHIHVVVMPDILPDGDGVKLCTWIAETYPDTIRLLYGTPSTVNQVLQAINEGHVAQYITDAGMLQTAIDAAITAVRASTGNATLVDQLRATNHLLERKVEQSTRDLIALNEQLRLALDEIETLKVHDEQTDLYNRRALLDRLAEAYRHAARYHTTLSCIVCDIAQFNAFNNNYGYEAGNAILHETATRLRRNIREVDIACRVGGDSFLAILPHTSSTQARVVIDHLYQALVLQPYQIGDEIHTLNFRFGIAEMTSAVSTPTMLLQRTLEAGRLARGSEEIPPTVTYPDDENT